MGVDLGELNKIEGVVDSFIYNKWGELVTPRLQYKDVRVAKLGKEVAFCSAFLEKVKRKIDFIELVFEDRRIIIRVSEDFFILVICEKKADFPLIKLTMNVINEEIKVDKDIKKLLRSLRGKKDLLAEAKGEAEWRELLEKMRLLA